MAETSADLLAAARKLDDEAAALRRRALDLRRVELAAEPLLARLVFAAYARCPCGAGLAYDPAAEDDEGVFRGPSAWDCSAVLLGTADTAARHTDRLPFAFWSVLSEQQKARTGGATTRPIPKATDA